MKLREYSIDTSCTATTPCYFAMVADRDQQTLVSKEFPLMFRTYMFGGRLFWNATLKQYSIQFNAERVTVQSMYNEGGRGLELSELIFFDKKLLTFDDRTGILYEYLQNGALLPKMILTETKNSSKGMKIEWATVKDNVLWVGSFGKEYIGPHGEILSNDKFQIALVNSHGKAIHLNWKPVYSKIRKMLNLEHPRYILHEAISWSSHLSKWVFLPRRASEEPYDEIKDETKGTNLLIIASEDFSFIEIKRISGILRPERGFSSFKFLPGTNDRLLLAVKTVEISLQHYHASYLTIIETLTGQVILDDVKIPFEDKYEGIEFIPKTLYFPFKKN
ncbi:apyrase-like isoform X2 [Hylaeus volcanicus]|nr:apyrase-like isoform X2 [Hylaeus volcanicus]